MPTQPTAKLNAVRLRALEALLISHLVPIWVGSPDYVTPDGLKINGRTVGWAAEKRHGRVSRHTRHGANDAPRQ